MVSSTTEAHDRVQPIMRFFYKKIGTNAPQAKCLRRSPGNCFVSFPSLRNVTTDYE